MYSKLSTNIFPNQNCYSVNGQDESNPSYLDCKGALVLLDRALLKLSFIIITLNPAQWLANLADKMTLFSRFGITCSWRRNETKRRRKIEKNQKWLFYLRLMYCYSFSLPVLSRVRFNRRFLSRQSVKWLITCLVFCLYFKGLTSSLLTN